MEVNIMKKKFYIVSGSGNPDLVKKIAQHLNTEPVFIDTGNFSNNYPRCKRADDITFAGSKVFIIANLQYQKIGSPLEELQLIFDACKSATEIHIILTYMCGKNDIPHQAGAVPTLAWMCYSIKKLRPKSINWFDPHHSSHIELFHPEKRRRFYFLNSIIYRLKELGVGQIAATDFGSAKRAYKIREFLELKTPLIFGEKDHKHSDTDGSITHHEQIGKIYSPVVAMGDDLALSLNTIKGASYAIRQKPGGKDIKLYAAAAHFDPTPDTFTNLKEILKNSTLNGFITTNSNPIDSKFIELPGFEVIDISERVAKLIEALAEHKSTSFMFDDV